MTTPRWIARAALIAALACVGCRPAGGPGNAPLPGSADGGTVNQEPTAEERFAAFSAAFLDGYLEHEPVRATEAGDHRHDDAWPDPSVEGEQRYHAWLAQQLSALDGFADEGLGRQARIDRDIIRTQVASWLFGLDELRPPENNPLFYTGMVGDGLDPLVTREFAPIEVRLESLLARLRGVPGLVAVAKARLANPPSIHTETAIMQNKGLVELCRSGLSHHFGAVPAMQADLEAAAGQAADALQDFQAFLEHDLLPRSTGDFRLGRARFEKKLRLALDDEVDIDALADAARALFARTQEEMVATATELWPTLKTGQPVPPTTTPEEKKRLVRAVLAEVAHDRPTNATILRDAEETLREATDLVRAHDLVRLPEEPCHVIEMPEYRRGVAIAYCDASGPLEDKQQTFYAISPTPSDWDAVRAESFYKEYNRAILHDLTVHEAMPGHFLQLMHNNRFPSKLRAVFGSGPFIEGWAVYAEWLMAQHGFGGARTRLQRQKMALRMCANAAIDHEVHAGTMDEAQALALMKDEAFQEDGEAVAKWRRARLTSAQLTTYFYGFTELMKLRKLYEKRPGFSERSYHDLLLSFGSPPPRHIRAILAEELGAP